MKIIYVLYSASYFRGYKKIFFTKNFLYYITARAWTCNNSSPPGHQLTEHPQGRFVHQKGIFP